MHRLKFHSKLIKLHRVSIISKVFIKLINAVLYTGSESSLKYCEGG